jgi:hypothetical protein
MRLKRRQYITHEPLPDDFKDKLKKLFLLQVYGC